ncbi:MAG TPA: hypothetical protein VKB08_03440 [Bradyrhizobium sp.]|nr:hypothetical protein [Bradyrhizobium sp.]
MRVACRSAIAAVALLAGACTATPQMPVAQSSQPQCAQTAFPPNERIAVWSVDKFAGRYVRGADIVAVRRDEHRLLVEGWTLGTRQLTADSVESWTWRDGCGVRYEFMLPPDGPGAWLKIVMPDGQTSDWHR